MVPIPEDIPELGIEAGYLGTVDHTHAVEGEAGRGLYVEVSRPDGTTIGFTQLEADEEGTRQVVRQRDQAPVGDVEGAVENLVDHYEEWGDTALRLLAQEERVAPFRSITDAGRAFHHEWVERTFAPLLAKRNGEERRRLLAELIAVCDVYFWKLLRRDLGLSREQTELAITETILALEGET